MKKHKKIILLFMLFTMVLFPANLFGLTENPNIDRPFVVRTFPNDGETMIPVNARIKIMFNKQMDYLTFNKTSVMLMDNVGGMVDGVISYESRSYNLSFTPSSNLARGEKYTLSIPAYLVRDVDGNAPMENISFSFVTANDKTNIPELYSNNKNPKIIRCFPDKNANDVPLDVTLSFDVSMDLDRKTVTEDCIELNDGIKNYRVKVYYSEHDRQILVVPEKHLIPGKVYNVILLNNFRSKRGHNMLGNYILSFSTRQARDDTPPVIVEHSPVESGVNVSVNTRITADFSEPMNPLSLNTKTFLILEENKPVEGRVMYDIRTKKAVFIPVKRLENDKRYTCLITKKVSDVAGNSMRGPVEWTFETRKKKIVIKPVVLKTTPRNGEKNVPVDSKILVYFNKAMSEATANAFNVKFEDERGAIPITTGFIKGGNFVTVIPAKGLEYEKKYKVWISPDICDPEGNKLGSEYRFEFRTEARPDLTPPVITKVEPSENFSAVKIDSPVNVYFSESINPETLDERSLILRDYNGNVLDGKLTYNKTKKILSFMPKSRFAYKSIYTVEVQNRLADLAGNIINSAKIWKFTTVSPPDLSAPRVISTVPFEGEKFVSISTNIKIFFSEIIRREILTDKTLQVYDEKGNSLKGKINYDESLKSIIFSPERNFKYSSPYRVVLQKNIQDLAGNGLKESVLLHFETENAPDNTRPELVSTSPLPEEKNVSVKKKFTVSFTEALNPVTINVDTVYIETVKGRKIPCKIDYLEANYIVLAKPLERLPYESEIRLVVSRKVTDASGNRLASTIIIPFFTEKEPDHEAPYLISSNPANSSPGFSINGAVSLKFNEVLKDKSIDEKSIILASTNIDDNREIPVKISLINDNTTLVVAPARRLEYETEYRLTVKEVRDLSNNRNKSPVKLFFRTERAPDTEGPRIVWSNPSEKKLEINHLEDIKIRFSEPLLISTINGTSVDLRDIEGTLPSDIQWEASRNTLIIKPDNGLKPGNNYFLLIDESISDKYGNKLSTPMRLHFRTKKIVDRISPRVVKIHPGNGANMIPLNEKIITIFSEPVNVDSLNRHTVMVFEDGKSINYTLKYNNETNHLKIIPHNGLVKGMEYRITLTQGITDLHGNSLAKPVSWAFLAGTAAKVRNFSIISLKPHEGMKNVAPGSHISVIFNSKIDAASVNPYTFFLLNDNKVVRGKTKISASGKEIVLVPEKKLKANKKYTVKLTEGIKNIYGKNLMSTKEFYFETIRKRVLVKK